MGRRAQEQENHWPGFVDALSTIVMVVTFLLIILAVVIFVLSQSIAKSFVESMTQQQDKGGGDMQSSEAFDAAGAFRSDTEPTETPTDASAAEGAEAKAQASTARSAAKTAVTQEDDAETVTGDNLTTLAEEELSDTPEIDGEDLAVRSRRVFDEEESISIGTPDITEESAQNIVTEAATFLTIAFDPAGTKINEESTERIAEFLDKSQASLEGRKIAIWSFMDPDGSVSQARRAAYYRALAARNSLLENGYLAENISLEIRPSPSPENNNTVRLVVQE